MSKKLIKIIKYTDSKSKWLNKKLAIITLCQLVIMPFTSSISSEALQRKMIWFLFGFVLICIRNISYSNQQYNKIEAFEKNLLINRTSGLNEI
jgi:hypothetical protein